MLLRRLIFARASSRPAGAVAHASRVLARHSRSTGSTPRAFSGPCTRPLCRLLLHPTALPRHGLRALSPHRGTRGVVTRTTPVALSAAAGGGRGPTPPPSSSSSGGSKRTPPDNDKRLAPRPPDGGSPLVPLAKAALALGAAVVLARAARPLGILLARPVFVVGAGSSLLAAGMRVYGGYSWKASFGAAAAVVVCSGVGLVAWNALEWDRSTATTTVPADRQRELTQRALSLLEAEVGSPVRMGATQTAARKKAETTAEVGRVNAAGEPIATVAMPVRDVYTRGQLKEGTLVVRMRRAGKILPEWEIDSVDVDVDLGDSGGGVQRVRVFPKAAGATPAAAGGVRLLRPES